MSENVTKKYATLLRSQIELIKMFPRETQLDLLWMLIDYELDGIEPVMESDEDGPSKLQIFWNMSRPLADARAQKAINGRKGGIQKAKNSKNVAKSSKRLANSSKVVANSSKALADSSTTLADKEKDKDMDMDKEYPYPTDMLLDGASLDKGDNKKEDENYVDIDWDSIPEP